MKEENQFDKVLDTLTSNSVSLKELAEQSGLDPFTFYQGGDLTDLDISDQDLTGLNFDRTIFEGSKLDRVTYDAGAFNGAILDESYAYKRDKYEFFLNDVFSAERFGLYFFCRFRPETLELGIRETNLTYGNFARLCSLNPDTLRKARRSLIVAGDTAVSICQALLEGWSNAGFDDGMDPAHRIRQPFIELLDLQPNSAFKHIVRDEFLAIFRDDIMFEAKNGPMQRREYRSTFGVSSWWAERATMFED